MTAGEKMSDTETAILTKEDIISLVKDFIVNNFLFGQEDEPINDSDSFLGKGIIDSTGILELIDFAEESYGINIDDNELIPENLDSLDNISRFILFKKG